MVIERIVTKKEITEVLKNAGMKGVRMSTSDFDFSNGKAYKDYNGKGVKGIRGGSVGPITCTDAWKTHNNETLQKVVDALNNVQESHESTTFDGVTTKVRCKISETQYRDVLLAYDTFPTYTRSADLDPSYMSYWLVVTFKDGRY